MNEIATDARALANAVARASYGQLVAIIAARTGDIAAAEDALSEAFAKALAVWPERGVPDNPEGWLVVTARRSAGRSADRLKRFQRMAEMTEDIFGYSDSSVSPDFKDERLKLLFACAHPAIAEKVRTPLMLQTVLGLDADKIGRAFLVSGPAMGQRLVRAKSKIRDAGIPFAVPDESDFKDRLQDVLAAIYVTFNTGWDDLPGTTDGKEDFAEEAIYLAKLVVDLIPDSAEALGLLALMLHCEARRPARRDREGNFVPLSEQDPGLWQHSLIGHAENYLQRAAQLKEPGRFQTEAAIQSVHTNKGLERDVRSNALVQLYDLLVQQSASLGAAVSRAAAYADADQLDEAIDILEAMDSKIVGQFQPYWVVFGTVLKKRGSTQAANVAFDMALKLTKDPAVKRFIENRNRPSLH